MQLLAARREPIFSGSEACRKFYGNELAVQLSTTVKLFTADCLVEVLAPVLLLAANKKISGLLQFWEYVTL